jgi:hypothetical protein
MRVCAKCGAFSNDASLGFCFHDGTPMIDVDQTSELFEQGTRFIENVEKVARRQSRRLKWRRLIVTATTVLVTAMVISVIAVNGVIYLKPPAREDVSTQASPSPLPVAVDSSSPTPGPLITPDPSPSPSVEAGAPVADVSATPRETVTPGPSSPETPTPKATATATPTPTPMDSPTPKPTQTATPSPTPQPSTTKSECSEADQNRETQALIKRFEAGWQRSIQGERASLLKAYAPDGKNAEVMLGPVSYQGATIKACASVLITARYSWTVKIISGMNGPRGAADVKEKTVIVPKNKRFGCGKLAGIWFCN